MITMQTTRLTDECADGIFGTSSLPDFAKGLFRAIVLDHGGAANDTNACNLGVADMSDVDMFYDDGTPLMVGKVKSNEGLWSYIGSKFTAENGWKTFDGASCNVDKYLSQWQQTRVFANESRKKVVAFVSVITSDTWYRAFCSSLFKIMTWYYPSPTQEDIAFFRSLSISKANTDEMFVDSVVAYINRVCDNCEWEEKRLHLMLDGVANYIRENRMTDLRAEIESNRNNIEMLLRRLNEAYDTSENCRIELAGLEALGDQSDDTYFNFFNSHKGSVTVSRIDGRTIYYDVVGDLEHYDEFELERNYENRGQERSILNRRSDKAVEYVVKHILLEKRGRIRQTASFRLGAGCLVQCMRGVWNRKDLMPNQHIYVHGCSGENDKYYHLYAQDNDWEMGVEQSISATKNLNVGDSVVINETIAFLPAHKALKTIWVTDGSPLGNGPLPEGAHLVSYEEFIEIVDKKLKEEAGNE